MKEGAQPAAFTFNTYRIGHFTFTDPAPEQQNLNVEFSPSGIYNQKEGSFNLNLKFIAFYGTEKIEVVKTTLEAFFNFESNMPKDQIPEYFYNNCLAIAFPYLRAFVTTLTSVSNTKPLILPIMNLSGLASDLISNTIFN